MLWKFFFVCFYFVNSLDASFLPVQAISNTPGIVPAIPQTGIDIVRNKKNSYI